MATKEKDKVVNIGNTDKNRLAVSNELQKLLADEFVLYTKTRNFHWNVRGMSFGELHKFFEQQYDQLALMVDEVAERIRQLGFQSAGTMAEFLKLARLKEQNSEGMDAPAMIKSLLNDHEAIIRSIREAIPAIDDKHNDAGSADFVTGIMEKHEKMAWMLRAHIS